jgi:hypothetical protein
VARSESLWFQFTMARGATHELAGYTFLFTPMAQFKMCQGT